MRFDDAAVVAGYASARPPVHPLVVDLAVGRLGLGAIEVALDIGCGAGASTRPLLGRAEACVAIDPSAAMVHEARRHVPGAQVLVAAAEALPLADRTVDLVGAAGSLEFADVGLAVAELVRVLRPGGAAFSYDFSTGRRLADGPDLAAWFDRELLRRWPRPVGPARSVVAASSLEVAGLVEVDHRSFEVKVPMSRRGYVEYLLTESFLTCAVGEGQAPTDIGSWIEETVPWPDDQGAAADVVFSGYLLTARAP